VITVDLKAAIVFESRLVEAVVGLRAVISNFI
jgi:hypothetical protein